MRRMQNILLYNFAVFLNQILHKMLEYLNNSYVNNLNLSSGFYKDGILINNQDRLRSKISKSLLIIVGKDTKSSKLYYFFEFLFRFQDPIQEESAIVNF